MMYWLDGFQGRAGVFRALLLCLMLSGCSIQNRLPEETQANAQHLHHLVVVWLKQPGDAAARQRYIEASQSLQQFPGVISYSIGMPANIKRSRTSVALDESYDVAIAGVFENQQTFEAFLQNPEYLRIAQEVLRPLVARYQVYDFLAP